MTRGTRETLRALAVAGNATALGLLVLFLLNAPALSRHAAAPFHVVEPGVEPPRARLLLVLIDGLRADVAADARLMPELQRLAARGSRGVAHVEALIPTTIAGVRASVEGIVVAPASVVFDFASPGAPNGGCFATVRARGGRSFVSGPRLWRDLYGAWIDEAVTTMSLLGEDDQRLLEETLRRVGDPAWDLLVVHFSRTDVAAHLAGGASPRYRAAAAWCDAALGQLVRAAGPAMNVMVTADHGVTDRGGHAGPERDVLRVPVILTGPGAPSVPHELQQVEVAQLIEATLHRGMTESSPGRVDEPAATRFLGANRWWRAACVVMACLAAAGLLSSARPLARSSRSAFWLHAQIWMVAALGAREIWVGTLAGVVALGWMARRRPLLSLPIAACLTAGVGAAVLRLVWAKQQMGDEHGLANTSGFFSFAAPALLALLLGTCIGWLWRRFTAGAPRRATVFGQFAGAAAIILSELALHSRSQTVSLSTLDVRLVFQASGWCMPAALCLAALQPFTAPLLVLLGACFAKGRLDERLPSLLLSGAAAVWLGEALAAALLLTFSHPDGNPVAASLALGLLLRTAGAVALLFPLIAVMVWLLARPRSA